MSFACLVSKSYILMFFCLKENYDNLWDIGFAIPEHYRGTDHYTQLQRINKFHRDRLVAL